MKKKVLIVLSISIFVGICIASSSPPEEYGLETSYYSSLAFAKEILKYSAIVAGILVFLWILFVIEREKHREELSISYDQRVLEIEDAIRLNDAEFTQTKFKLEVQQLLVAIYTDAEHIEYAKNVAQDAKRKMLADIDDGFTVKELNITKLLLGDYWVKQGIACLSVVIDYEVKDKDSEVKALQHTFRFKRRKEAKTSFFISKETRVNCKQCGAPIRKNTLSNCEYCGCVTYWLPFSWKLTSVESYTDVLYL